MSAQSQPVIELRHVSKRFVFTPDAPQSVLESLLSVFSRPRRRQAQDLWAVRDVSFSVLPGQCLGIVGRNGSGKSTLLKLISRIVQPTEGRITVRGRVSALLELGAGFHPDLTGRENIYLNAAVLGLNQEEAEKQFRSIVAFSELEEFIDMPVKHYSSGMYMRLGFSVAIHVYPDVLIVDEILAVGDQTFQTKCLDRIMEMKRQGVTIVIISHDLSMMRKLCTDLIWLDHGRVKLAGPTEEIVELYSDHLFSRVGAQMKFQNQTADFRRWGTRQVEIMGVRLLDEMGDETTIFQTGDSMTVEIGYVAHEPVLEPEFGLGVHRYDGLHVTGPNNLAAGLELGLVEGPGVMRYHVAQLPLLPARYQLTVAVHDSRRPLAYDYHEEAYAFRVVEGGSREKEGVVAIPATWEWQILPREGQLPLVVSERQAV